MSAVRRPGISNRPYSAQELETAVRLSIAGESDPAIGRVIGRSAHSVRRVIDRVGLPGILCNGQSHGLRLCVPRAAFSAIETEAARRQTTAHRLAGKILTVVANDGLFRSILDL